MPNNSWAAEAADASRFDGWEGYTPDPQPAEGTMVVPITEPGGRLTGLQWCRACSEISVTGTEHECGKRGEGA